MTSAMQIAVASARQLGWDDGNEAREAMLDGNDLVYPQPEFHGIGSSKARIQYHQGWILGRLGSPIYHRCTTCHIEHPDGEHVAGLVP